MEKEVKQSEDVIMLYHGETTIQLGGSIHALWCEKDTKRFVVSSGSKQRIILSGAVNVKSGKVLLHHSNSMNSFDFLINILGQYTCHKIIVVTDNASWHKSKQLSPVLEGNQRL